jgi:hypothetical protein
VPSKAEVLKRVSTSLLGVVLLASAATLLPATASASISPVGFAVVCAHGDYAVDGWLNGNFVGKASPGNCEVLDGRSFNTVNLFVDGANPGIFLRNVVLSPDHVPTVTCSGTPQNHNC